MVDQQFIRMVDDFSVPFWKNDIFIGMLDLRKRIKEELDAEAQLQDWKKITPEQWDQMGQYVLDKYSDRFTPEILIDRIPFLKDYDLSVYPGNSIYDDRTTGMQYRVEFEWVSDSKDFDVKIGENLIKFDMIKAKSEFVFFPHKNNDIVIYNFAIKNQVFLKPNPKLNEQDKMTASIFAQATGLVCQKLSYNGSFTLYGHKATFFKNGKEAEYNDPDVFPEEEFNTIVNDINKNLFTFEEYLTHLGINLGS